MPDSGDAAAALHDTLADHSDVTDAEVASVETLQEEIEDNLAEYPLSVAEAKRAVANTYLPQSGPEIGAEARTTQSDRLLDVGLITDDDMWGTARVRVDELWEPQSEAIQQVGLIGDDSGKSKFTVFTSSGLPRLEEGDSYRLESVVTDEYQGNYSIKLTTVTTVSKLDADIEIGEPVTTRTGAIVDVQDNSGLITRCPVTDCSRVIDAGACPDHDTEADSGVVDLRLIATLDDGTETTKLIFDADATATATGVTLEAAQKRVQESLTREQLRRDLADEVLFQYQTVTGRVTGDNFLVESLDSASPPEVDHLQARTREVSR